MRVTSEVPLHQQQADLSLKTGLKRKDRWPGCEQSSALPGTGSLLHQFQSSLAQGASSISRCRWEAAWSSFDSSRWREEI